ncbi:GntR family transcriptional regulator [Pseudorhodobacter sp.]|uniref:GntR family transcriptional regulator n=1 Tax=Pseudorhodobacter sp. TaxID=1934400 RepID=UPI002648AE62|nr:GntR family transcriptional regulator [Pseudorhodobacter sp.]MDN5787418.1 GntR family transcriptional regulator [Pseudorhodobacter sp.]
MTVMPQTLGDSAFRKIKAMILDGTLPPGTRLPEKNLADQLGVSRTPVREAIGQLVSEGFATRSHGGAPLVSIVSLTDIMEILHVRSLLECEAARKAAISGQSMQKLADLRGHFSGFLQQRPSPAEHTAVDMQLHLTLAHMAGSKLLMELIEGLKIKTRMYDQGSIPARFEPGCHEHLMLIDAVIAQDPEAASAAMKLHLSHTRQAIFSHLHHPF